MGATPRLSLPFLNAGQAQKEFTHNEALQMLDVLVAAAVEEGPRTEPPSSPSTGASFIVDASPTGAWTGKPDHVAAFTSGGWRFAAPIEGMSVYVKAGDCWANYRLGAWEMGLLRGSGLIIDGEQVVGERLAAIASPTGGTTIDSEARETIDEILSAMQQHGLIQD
jgi:hypothetical protein